MNASKFLTGEVLDVVKRLAAKHNVDLNSVSEITSTMVELGEPKTGLIIHVRHVANDRYLVEFYHVVPNKNVPVLDYELIEVNL